MKKKFLILSIFLYHYPVFTYNYNSSNQYYQYNHSSPFNQNYYDPAQFVYPNRTEAEKALSAQIEQAFQNDPNLASYASSIQVNTIGNEVTLSGLVDSDRIRLRAESKAKNILGVKKVNNAISVEKTK